MTCLVDVNVWVALALGGHIHQAVARQWFEEPETDRIIFCRITQQAFLRLSTNRRVMGENVLAPHRAWEVYDTFYRDSRVRFAAEPAGLEPAWRAATRHPHAGPNFWTDAYLAAFAAAAGCTVVTFDRAFLQHRDVEVRILNASR